MRWGGHPHEDSLVEHYVASLDAPSGEPSVAGHLAACVDCQRRYDSLVGLLSDLRVAADHDTDSVFPPDRLVAQQKQILHRLEQLHRSARVIAFPGRVLPAGSRRGLTLAPRWVAVAAASGLFIGVAVGGYLAPTGTGQTASVERSAPTPSASMLPMATSTVVAGNTQPDADEDAFLIDLELALERPHAPELLPFDALTPHVQDIDSVTR